MRRYFLCLLLALSLVSCGRSKDEPYKIGRDPTYFPLQLMGLEGVVSAFSDALLRAIGEEEEFPVALYAASGEQVFELLRKGELDGVLSPMMPIPAYREFYDFSDPYLYTGPVLVVPANSDVKHIQELHGKTVGVRSNSTAAIIVAKIPMVVIAEYENISAGLVALANGAIDGVLMDALPAHAFMRDFYQQELKIVTLPLDNQGLRLVVLKGENKELVESFNAGLKKLVDRSDYQKLAEQWGLDLGEGPQKV